ncbi:ImmA/IrrE family metallo-endopeptidase [Streptococcus suis]
MARKVIPLRQYIQHWDYAVPVIEATAKKNSLPLEQVTFQHIINHFERTYNIHFVFFEKDPFPGLPPVGLLSTEHVRYRGLVTNPDVTYLDDIICQHNDGFTIYDEEEDKYLVYINHTHIKHRVIFTILHELAHIEAHFNTGRSDEVALACASNYLDNPLETEASTIASLFYINNNRMVWHLKNGHSYEEMKQANTISDNALFNRLVDFVHYRIFTYEEHLLDEEQQRQAAINLVKKFKQGNNLLQKYYDIDV